MDTHTSHDPNNPINWNGKDAELCERCHNELTPEEEEEKLCFECIEEKETEEEERKELEKQFLKFPELEEDEKIKINIKAQRDTLKHPTPKTVKR